MVLRDDASGLKVMQRDNNYKHTMTCSSASSVNRFEVHVF